MAARNGEQGRAAQVLPLLGQLRGYRRSWLRGDLLAGVTVAAYLVPQVMAYAAIAGLPPVVGLWAIIPPLVVYPLLGSSRQVSVGLESTTALMTVTVVAPLAVGDAGRYAALAAALAVTVGLLALLAWALRLGFIADLLSQPILVGYLAGFAVIMMVGQLGKISGVPVKGDTLLAEVTSFARHVHEIQPWTLAVGVAALVFLVVVQRLFPWLPGPLLAVLLAAAAVVVLGLRGHGVAVVGDIPVGLPRPSLPRLGDLRTLVVPAIGVLLVAYTDDVLTSRAFAAKGGYRVDANRELLALGACNIAAGLFHGMAASASGSRTALGVAAGSRTQLYSLTAFVAVLCVVFFGRPVLAQFPLAALGALVIYAAVRLIDVAAFRRLMSFRRNEFLLAVAAFAGVLVVNVLYGIVIAIGLSVAELLVRVARPHDAIQGRVPGLAGMHDIDDYPEARTIPGLVVYRYDSPLFFANARDFERRALAAVDHEGGDGQVRWFVLNVEANVEVDITALDALESLRATLTGRGIVFALARVKQDLLTSLTSHGLADRIGPDLLFPTLPTAVDAYEQWRRDQGPDATTR